MGLFSLGEFDFEDFRGSQKVFISGASPLTKVPEGVKIGQRLLNRLRRKGRGVHELKNVEAAECNAIPDRTVVRGGNEAVVSRPGPDIWDRSTCDVRRLDDVELGSSSSAGAQKPAEDCLLCCIHFLDLRNPKNWCPGWTYVDVFVEISDPEEEQ